MTIKRRLDRLIAKRGCQHVDEPLITLMRDGKEITLLDLSGTGISWSQMFESIASHGNNVSDNLKDS